MIWASLRELYLPGCTSVYSHCMVQFIVRLANGLVRAADDWERKRNRMDFHGHNRICLCENLRQLRQELSNAVTRRTRPPFPKKVKGLKDWYALRKIWREADAQNKGWCSSVCKKEYLKRIHGRRRDAMEGGE